MVKEREADQDKIDGDVMIDGLGDRHLIKKDHHQVTVETKIFKHLYLNVNEIKCNFIR